MSMRDYPGSGYVVPASDFTKLFSEELQKKYTELLDDGDDDAINAFLGLHLPRHIPPFELYCLRDEDYSEEMEDGVYYFIFDDEDLFEKIPKKEYQQMMDSGIKPEFSRWTIWG